MGPVCNSHGVLGPPSQALQPHSNTGPETVPLLWFGLFPFRLMLLRESLLIFFPRGIYIPPLTSPGINHTRSAPVPPGQVTPFGHPARRLAVRQAPFIGPRAGSAS